MDWRRLEQRYKESLSSLVSSLDSEWTVSRRIQASIDCLHFSNRTNILPSQGWKIHVTFSAGEAVSFCERVLPALISEGVCFKIPADVQSIVQINSGSGGETQAGKVLTIYPREGPGAADIALLVDTLWPTSQGPTVLSDLGLRPGSAVSFRYGSFDGRKAIDRFGRPFTILLDPANGVSEDRRSLDGMQPSWAIAPLPDLTTPGNQSSGDEISIGGAQYLPLMLLHHSPRGRVYMGVSLSDASTVVIKKRRKGVHFESSQRNGCAAHEYEVLKTLSSLKALSPTPLGFSMMVDGAPVLITEYVVGTPFVELEHQKQIRSLRSFANAIQSLHDVGYVHRDIKLSNAISTADGVRLVDFELAAPIGAVGLIGGGTQGYLPPESNECANPAADVFALGICVAHVFLRFDPAGIAPGAGRLVGMLHQFVQHEAASVVRRFTHPRASERPTSAAATALLTELESQGSIPGTSARIRIVSRKWCLRIAHEVGESVSALQRNSCIAHVPGDVEITANSELEAINMGGAGVALGLVTIDQACRTGLFRTAIEEQLTILASRPPQPFAHGLFTGNCGVALVMGVAASRWQRTEWEEACRLRLEAAMQVSNDCDLFSGTAGVLWGIASLCQFLRDPGLSCMANHCADHLLRHAIEIDNLRVWAPAEHDGRPSTGAAHGSAGIAMALATWGRLSGRSDCLEFAFDTFERLFHYGRINDNQDLRDSVCDRPSRAPEMMWCHGVAGHLWCLLLAFGDHPRLREFIDWCVTRCTRQRYLGSPLLCHGVAGELELWRMGCGFPRLAPGARQCARSAAGILRLQLRRINGVPFWGTEDPQVVRQDLWVGSLGPAAELALYAAGERAPILSPEWLHKCALGQS
jgi:serine/threonine protein kinase